MFQQPMGIWGVDFPKAPRPAGMVAPHSAQATSTLLRRFNEAFGPLMFECLNPHRMNVYLHLVDFLMRKEGNIYHSVC